MKDVKKAEANVSTVSNEGISREDAFALMDAAKPEDLKSLNSNYFKLEQGERKVMQFTGMTVYNSPEQGEMEAVILEDKDGISYVCPTTQLVSTLKELTDIPAFVRLTNTGKRKNGKGFFYDYYNIEVFPK